MKYAIFLHFQYSLTLILKLQIKKIKYFIHLEFKLNKLLLLNEIILLNKTKYLPSDIK